MLPLVYCLLFCWDIILFAQQGSEDHQDPALSVIALVFV